jgi:hypothetical protein
MRRGEMKVWNLDLTLRELKMPDARSVRRNHIFRKWTEAQKNWFWRAFGSVYQWHRRVIFLHLTKATFGYITNATDSQLTQGLVNLDIHCASESRQEKMRMLLIEIHYRLHFDEGRTL